MLKILASLCMEIGRHQTDQSDFSEGKQDALAEVLEWMGFTKDAVTGMRRFCSAGQNAFKYAETYRSMCK